MLLAALVVVLQLPIALIRAAVEDRVQTREQALGEVTSTWGEAQTVAGPRLVVPYRRAAGDPGAAADFLNVLPTTLAIDGTLDTHALTRGLFRVPVYTGRLTLSGRFDPVELDESAGPEAELDWARAALVVEVTDPRALGGGDVGWEGRQVPVLPGTVGSAGRRGIHSPVASPEQGASFEVTLVLNGSGAIWFAPLARDTRLELRSNWPHPSFGGAWLPARREVGSGGFEATWRVPYLGRDYPQVWRSSAEPFDRVRASSFGTELTTPVDPYRMALRSTKYAPLFLAMTLVLLWMFDTLTGARVHLMQHLLVGAAMCLFYLLELSLSEHIGFMGAYGVAAGGVMGLIACYTTAVLGSVARGATVGGSVGLLYAYLLTLLSLERYALLVGSVGLFVALAAVMYLTRWVDWSRLRHADAALG